MPDTVHQVIITVRNPRPEQNDPGQVAEGYFVLRPGELVMTNPAGQPIRDKGGREWTVAIEPEQAGTERQIAARLTREIRTAFDRGKSDFDRPIRYGPSGVV